MTIIINLNMPSYHSMQVYYWCLNLLLILSMKILENLNLKKMSTNFNAKIPIINKVS